MLMRGRGPRPPTMCRRSAVSFGSASAGSGARSRDSHTGAAVDDAAGTVNSSVFGRNCDHANQNPGSSTSGFNCVPFKAPLVLRPYAVHCERVSASVSTLAVSSDGFESQRASVGLASNAVVVPDSG